MNTCSNLVTKDTLDQCEWVANHGKYRLNHLCDDVYRLRSLHLYCYESLNGTASAEGNDNDPHFLAGLRLFLNWMIERDKALHAEMQGLLEKLRSDGASPAGETVET